MERYQDKKVVIVGGTSGMGLATAKMLLGFIFRQLLAGFCGFDSAPLPPTTVYSKLA